MCVRAVTEHTYLPYHFERIYEQNLLTCLLAPAGGRAFPRFANIFMLKLPQARGIGGEFSHACLGEMDGCRHVTIGTKGYHSFHGLILVSFG